MIEYVSLGCIIRFGYHLRILPQILIAHGGLEKHQIAKDHLVFGADYGSRKQLPLIFF